MCVIVGIANDGSGNMVKTAIVRSTKKLDKRIPRFALVWEKET
jgi:hypothetical protein